MDSHQLQLCAVIPFPEILFFIAALMHVELPVNALYLCVIFLLLMIVFTLSVAYPGKP